MKTRLSDTSRLHSWATSLAIRDTLTLKKQSKHKKKTLNTHLPFM
ncbi:MAG: hypothetical protein ACK5PF_06550 [bacterium]|jgi:hypothetical protein